MESWFKLYEEEYNKLDNYDLKTELETQRFFYRLLERQISLTEYDIKMKKKDLEEYKNSEKCIERNIARKQDAIIARQKRLELLHKVNDACKTYAMLLEAEYTMRQRLKKHTGKQGTTAKQRREQLKAFSRDRSYLKNSEQVESVWNKDAFYAVAEDRGYKVREVLLNDVAKVWDVSPRTADRILKKGNFTWGQVLLLGHMFEMTPREFAECFMRGYFEEISEGKFRAWGDRKELIYKPKKKDEYVPPMEIIYVDESGEEVTEIEYFDMNYRT